MAIQPEPLNGGLVNSKDPAMLQPGELQEAYGCAYYPDNDALSRAPGAYLWGRPSTVTNDVDGLVSCRFADGSQQLLAQTDSAIWRTDAEDDTSSFTALITGISGGPQLQAVQYDGRHYIFNGVDPNIVFLSDLSYRKHGLKPSNTPLEPKGFAIGSAFSASASGYYEYWYTESIKYPDGQEIENAYAGAPLTVNVTSTANSPILEFPASPANVDALALQTGAKLTYYLYRSEMKVLESDSLYPIGRKVSQAEYKNNAGSGQRVTVTDQTTSSNTGALHFSSSDAIVANAVTSAFTGSAYSATDAIAAADAKSIQITCGTVNTLVPYANSAIIPVHNPGFSTFTGNILGIKVDVRAKSSVADIADIYVAPVHRKTSTTNDAIPATGGRPLFNPGLRSSGLTNFSPSISAKRQTITNTSYATYTFGGTTDAFLPSPYGWNISDFDSNFGLHIGVVFNSNKALATNTVDIDEVTVTVYYGASSTTRLEDEKLYDAVVVEESGVSLKFGAGGEPPVASCGTIFEGSLVTNDVATPNKIVWSVPGRPDSIPTGVYYLLLPGSDPDAITCLATVNDRLICGTKGSIYRINYLPNENDASFSRGQAISDISTTTGVLRPTCACLFSPGGGRQALAFVDANGIFATDGYTVEKLSSDLRWVGPSGTSVFAYTSGDNIYESVVALVNDPRTQTLRFILTNGDMYIGSYAARHKKQSGLKWTKSSATQVTNAKEHDPLSATVLRRSNGAWIVVYGYARGVITGNGANVWREDSSDTTSLHTLGAGITPSFSTRDIYMAGLGDEAELNSVSIVGIDRETGSSNKNIGATVNVTQFYTNAAANTSATIDIPGGITNSRIAQGQTGTVNCDAVKLDFTLDTTGMFEASVLLLGGEGFGESENRA